MSNLRLIPEGATVERTYLVVPSQFGTAEQEFPNTADGWDEAVAYAQQKWAEIVEHLKERQLSEGYAKTCATTQTRIDLRWVIRHPDGSATDTIIESYKRVMDLRTGGLKRPHVEAAILMTEPHDGHEPEATCPGCPHSEDSDG